MSFVLWLDQVAETTREERRFTELSFTGALNRFTASSTPTSRRDRSQLQEAVKRLEHFVSEDAAQKIEQRIDAAMLQGAQAAFSALGVSSDEQQISDALSASRDARMQRLKASQIEFAQKAVKGAAEAIALEAHRFAIRVQQAVDNGISEAAAAVHLVASHPPKPDFGVLDAAGKRWDAGRYLALGLRGAMLEARNQTYMDVMDARGIYVLRVDHAEEKPGIHNLQFATRTGMGAHLPLFAEIRGAVFHPNAKSVVAMV